MIGFGDILKNVIIAFFISLILGPILIPMLKRLKIGQFVRQDGPKSHLSKSGTPTMGGLMIMIALLVTSIFSGYLNRDIYILLIATLGFGLIGFIDDYIIVVRKDNQGLRAYQKIIGQLILAIILAYYQSQNSPLGTKLLVPFGKGLLVDLGILYIPFIVFVIVGTVNSVNLTDGLDGLATGITAIVLFTFGLIALKFKMINISVFSFILFGGCLGFLKHNLHPAKVFMGDTGSMGLGGGVAGIALLLDLPLLLPIIGGIYFVEALSVIIQVGSYKLRGKRVFLMSPLHHHFEHKGWKETKVVKVFWAITFLLSVIAYISIL